MKNIWLCILLLIPFIGISQYNPITPNTQVSILTVDVSNEVHTLYGHTAIRIKDETNQFDYVWNYGMFDFGTENFILKFIKGDLQYFAAAYPYANFEYSYQQENRSIYEQVLNISTEEKQKLYDTLNQSIFSEEKFYTYKFIDRNCTTKAIDAVNKVLKNEPIKNNLHQTESYRTILFDYQKNNFWLNFGINSIFGHRPDEQAKILFLPLDLMKVLNKTEYNNQKLISKTTTLFEALNTEKTFSFFDSIYFLITILALIIILNKNILNNILFSILGLIGLFFIMVGFYSFHQEVLLNYNILLFNPLLLAILFYKVIKNDLLVKKLCLISLLCLGVYILYMINKAHLIIMLPLIITQGILIGKIYLKKV